MSEFTAVAEAIAAVKGNESKMVQSIRNYDERKRVREQEQEQEQAKKEQEQRSRDDGRANRGGL